MAANDPDVRTEVARRAGSARWVGVDPDEARAARQAAAAATNAPAALARRIVKAWPGLRKAERVEVLHILAAILPKR